MLGDIRGSSGIKRATNVWEKCQSKNVTITGWHHGKYCLCDRREYLTRLCHYLWDLFCLQAELHSVSCSPPQMLPGTHATPPLRAQVRH